MSVRTTADRDRDKAMEYIVDAIDLIGDIVLEKTWGHDEYSVDYKTKLKDSLDNLLQIRLWLKG